MQSSANTVGGEAKVIYRQNVGKMTILGFEDGGFKMLDESGQIIKFGRKVFTYDGSEQMSVEAIYDDGDKTIPDYLRQ